MSCSQSFSSQGVWIEIPLILLFPTYVWETLAVIISTSLYSFIWRSITENIEQKRDMVHILKPYAFNFPYCLMVDEQINYIIVYECNFACIDLSSKSNIKKYSIMTLQRSYLLLLWIMIRQATKLSLLSHQWMWWTQWALYNCF